MNYNFVTTEPIFKIRNSAESYCLAELQYPSPNSLILPSFYPSPPARAKFNFIHICKVLKKYAFIRVSYHIYSNIQLNLLTYG